MTYPGRFLNVPILLLLLAVPEFRIAIEPPVPRAAYATLLRTRFLAQTSPSPRPKHVPIRPHMDVGLSAKDANSRTTPLGQKRRQALSQTRGTGPTNPPSASINLRALELCNVASRLFAR